MIRVEKGRLAGKQQRQPGTILLKSSNQEEGGRPAAEAPLLAPIDHEGENKTTIGREEDQEVTTTTTI